MNEIKKQKDEANKSGGIAYLVSATIGVLCIGLVIGLFLYFLYLDYLWAVAVDVLPMVCSFLLFCFTAYVVLKDALIPFLYRKASMSDVEIYELPEFKVIKANTDIKNLSVGYSVDEQSSEGGYWVKHGHLKKGNAIIALSKNKITAIGGFVSKKETTAIH